MLTLDGTAEIERRYQVFGIRNVTTGAMIGGEYDKQSDAEFDCLLYPSAEVVTWEIFETVARRCGELPARVGG